MAFFVNLEADPLRTLAFGAISGTYAEIGTPLTHPGRIVIVQNLTDVLLTYSGDGITDHFVLPTGGQVIIDVAANEFQGSGFVAPIGFPVYVKGSPTTGSTYVSVFYANDRS